MAISSPSLQNLPVQGSSASWPNVWGTWFSEVWQALSGWTHTSTKTLTYDFGLIGAQSQATTTLTLTGARVGDAVMVRPTTAVNGIIVDGTVTANDTITVRAVNYSTGGIDPASQVYRVIVFQQ